MAFQPPNNPDASITDSLAMRQIGATVSPKDITEATKPYGLDKYKAKGKSDTELRATAVSAVIKWWRKQRADASAAAWTAKQEAKKSAAAAASGGSGASGGAGGSGGSGGSSGGMSNTAVATHPSSGGVTHPLAPILTAAERRAQEAAVAQRELALKQQRAREAAARAVAAQRLQLLTAAGLQNRAVPTYALTSIANLKAWISAQQQAARRAAASTSGGLRPN